jgi:choline-glycine betaine transporter
VQCDNCRYIFRQPPRPKTGVTKLALTIFFIHVLAIMATVAMVYAPELADKVHPPQFVQNLGAWVSPHLGAFIVLVAATATATLLLCLLASLGSSILQKQQLSKEFELYPKPKGTTLNRLQNSENES